MLTPPSSLSPSKLTTFQSCPLRVKYSAIDNLPDPSGEAALKGTLVHSALESLFALPCPERRLSAALSALDHHSGVMTRSDEFRALRLKSKDVGYFLSDADKLVRNYFLLEDPQRINAIGVELKFEAVLGGVKVRGIIDRLDLQGDEFVITDYKTGRVPSERYESKAIAQLHIYSAMLEQLFGRRAKRVQLLYLSGPTVIHAEPSAQTTRGTKVTVKAVQSAVERACERDDFRPVRSKLCDWCAYREICPAWS